jgi:hypothetical protein
MGHNNRVQTKQMQSTDGQAATLTVLLLYHPTSEHHRCCLASTVHMLTGDLHQAGEAYRTTR